MQFSGKVIAVTGAGGGIGSELVLGLLARGANVAAIDLRQEGLDGLAERADAGEKLALYSADITDRDAVLALPETIIAQQGAIDGLINNAGMIQPFVPVNELGFDAIDRMIRVNLTGTINMVKAFLPHLLERPEAHLANVASMGGFIPFPGQTLYSASKAGVKLLTEGLYSELLDTNLGVSVIMPGAINTGIAQHSGVEIGTGADEGKAAAIMLPPDEAARIILDGIEAKRLHILVGKDARALNLMSRIAPGWAIRFIQKKMKSMGI